jgi:hypothetical protein
MDASKRLNLDRRQYTAYLEEGNDRRMTLLFCVLDSSSTAAWRHAKKLLTEQPDGPRADKLKRLINELELRHRELRRAAAP